MPPDDASADETPPSTTAGGPLPLGRNASRALVIGSILFVLVVVGSGSWLMLHLARSRPPSLTSPPADTVDTAAVPAP